MATTVKNGNEPSREVKTSDAQRQVADYLGAAGAVFDYIHLNSKTGEVELKAPGGAKVILKPHHIISGFEIFLC